MSGHYWWRPGKRPKGHRCRLPNRLRRGGVKISGLQFGGLGAFRNRDGDIWVCECQRRWLWEGSFWHDLSNAFYASFYADNPWAPIDEEARRRVRELVGR